MLDGVDQDAVIARTEGVTAAFLKELLRKAALLAAEATRPTRRARSAERRSTQRRRSTERARRA